jgi:hypothetical protein
MAIRSSLSGANAVNPGCAEVLAGIAESQAAAARVGIANQSHENVAALRFDVDLSDGRADRFA